MNTFELGQKVVAEDRLHRGQEFDRKPGYMNEVAFKLWKRRGEWAHLKPQPVNGIYVGKRTLNQGYTAYEYEEGCYWVTTATLTAYLVVENEHKKPVAVLADDLRILDENSDL